MWQSRISNLAIKLKVWQSKELNGRKVSRLNPYNPISYAIIFAVAFTTFLFVVVDQIKDTIQDAPDLFKWD